MIFEFGLSQPVVINLFKSTLSKLEQLCASSLSESWYFDRVNLIESPTLTKTPHKGDVTLSDGSTVSAYGVLVTQPFEVVITSLTTNGSGGTALAPMSVPGSVRLRVGMEVLNGDARLCIDLDDLAPSISDIANVLKSGDPQKIEEFHQKITDAVHRCIPLRIPDLLSNLNDRLLEKLPSGGSLFKSTEVVNAGLALGPYPDRALLIRVEVEAADADANAAWTAFYAGSASAAPSPPNDWSMTLDRRLFGRMVSALLASIEAKASHLDFGTPSSHWSAKGAVVGFEGLMPKVVAKNVPTLTSTFEGKAVGACDSFGGLVEADLDFTADLVLAFAMAPKAAPSLRFYARIAVDVSFGEQFACGVLNLSVPLVSLFGPFGLALAVFLAAVLAALGGFSGPGLPASTEDCHGEYGVEVCDVLWTPMPTPMGVFYLSAVEGVARGLVLMGPVPAPAPSAPVKFDSKSSGFKWVPPYCAPIKGEADVQAEAKVYVFGPTVCDVRIVDDDENAYKRKFTPGGHTIEVTCTKPASQVPSYPCRLLVATTRGLHIIEVPAPSGTVDWDLMTAIQGIHCMDDIRQHVHWTKWPYPDDTEIIHPDLALIVVDVVVAGLGSGESVHLQADGQAIAAGMPGPLGFASVSGALDAPSVSAALSLAPSVRSEAAPMTRGAIDARLEFWRHAGSIGAIGSVHDVVGPAAGMCWLATTHGLLRVGLAEAAPVLIERIPVRGIHRLALTPYGLLAGGDDGLAMLDPDTGEMEALSDIGPVRLLARRGSVLHVVGGDALHTFNLVARQDRRGRLWSLRLDPVGTREVRDVRSAVLAGPYLLLQSEDAIGAQEVRGDGSLGALRSIPSRGIRAVHQAAGPDTREAFVAEFDGRVALMRIGSAADSPDLKLEALDLPGLPWFVGSRRASGCLLRTSPDRSRVDVFKLDERVDLMRREAGIRSAAPRA
jgi:hypothetical protein